MTLELFSQYWALLVASVLGTAILLFVLFRLYEASARGQLGNRVRVLQRRKSEVLQAQRRLDKASESLAGLQKRADSVKPRVLSEAGEAIEDARALKKIADDQVLVAQNQLRIVILEEFPPKRQDILRNKYL